MITVRTPCRAGILGNPSDGFFGKTISCPIYNFSAEVFLKENESGSEITLVPGPSDIPKYESFDSMIESYNVNGIYGGLRLVKSAIRQFQQYLVDYGMSDLVKKSGKKGFSIGYKTDIPRQVGLAGSSAIVTSTIKCLCEYYDVKIEKEIMSNYVLWSETKELKIAAGLQDRVCQVYAPNPVFMDFSEDYMMKKGFGKYKMLDQKSFPPMYLCFRRKLTHDSCVHNDMRARWERKEPLVIETMKKLANNTTIGYEALKSQKWEVFDKCINDNFDLRASIYKIPENNMKMIELARKLGATSKFGGGGGAIIGTYKNDESLFVKLKEEFGKLGCEVIKVRIEP